MGAHLNRQGARTTARLAAALTGVLFAGVMNASADEIHVYEGQSIQNAIDLAVDGDMVIVHPGAYYQWIRILDKNITVRSSDGPEVTSIDGSQGFDGALVSCNTGAFAGFTVTNGLERGMSLGGNALVADCIIIYNTAFSGGGVGGKGGGIAIGGDPLVIGCTISNNVAVAADENSGRGGGICVWSGNPIFVDCLFEDNLADRAWWPWSSSRGGAIFQYDGQITLIGCKFTGNIGTDGGALCGNAPITAINCIFDGNTSLHPEPDEQGHGGAVYCSDITPMLINCTFTGNRAEEGGALYLDAFSDGGAANCIFQGNSPDQIVDEGSAAITYCCVEGGWTGEGNIDADPLFIAEGRWHDNGTPNDPYDDIWEDGVYELLPGSPCIDAGDNTAVPDDITTDYAGKPRFVDDPDTVDTGFGDPPIVDIGAYEFQVEDTCPCDVNDDGVVNIDDLFDVLAHWGEGAGPYDVNDDGVVDIDDIFDVLAEWGPCP